MPTSQARREDPEERTGGSADSSIADEDASECTPSGPHVTHHLLPTEKWLSGNTTDTEAKLTEEGVAAKLGDSRQKRGMSKIQNTESTCDPLLVEDMLFASWSSAENTEAISDWPSPSSFDQGEVDYTCENESLGWNGYVGEIESLSCFNCTGGVMYYSQENYESCHEQVDMFSQSIPCTYHLQTQSMRSTRRQSLLNIVNNHGLTANKGSRAFQDLIGEKLFDEDPELALMYIRKWIRNSVSSLVCDLSGNYAVTAVVRLPWPWWELVPRELLQLEPRELIDIATNKQGVRTVRDILNKFYRSPQSYQATSVERFVKAVKNEIKHICGVGFGSILAEILYECDSDETKDIIACLALQYQSRPIGNTQANKQASLLSKIFMTCSDSRALVTKIMNVDGLLSNIAKRKDSEGCIHAIVRTVEDGQMPSEKHQKVRAELVEAIRAFAQYNTVERARKNNTQQQVDVLQKMLARLDACIPYTHEKDSHGWVDYTCKKKSRGWIGAGRGWIDSTGENKSHGWSDHTHENKSRGSIDHTSKNDSRSWIYYSHANNDSRRWNDTKGSGGQGLGEGPDSLARRKQAAYEAWSFQYQ